MGSECNEQHRVVGVFPLCTFIPVGTRESWTHDGPPAVRHEDDSVTKRV